MIWSIAWRNVWRNTKRSGILIGSIAFGIWAGVMMIGLMNGMMDQQMDAAIATRTSHVQIHAEGFRAHRDIGNSIPGGDSLLAVVRGLDGAKAASERIVLTAMASSATTGRGVMLVGIDPETEKHVTDLHSQVVEGDYFLTDRRNAVVIGRKLADKLGIGLGKKLVVTGQTSDGSISAGAFRVVGIYQTINSTYDEMALFAKRSDVDRLFDLHGAIHEIAIVAEDLPAIQSLAETLRLMEPDLDVATWRELSPELALSQDSTDQMNQIFMIIILAALIFGITNTMLMGVLERMRELGVVLAIGMRHGTLFGMIVLETVFLSLLGGIGGILLGAGSIAWLGRTGIDFSVVGKGLESMGFAAIVYPTVAPNEYPSIVLLVITTALIASIYPGLKAIRLNPIQAIRTY